MKKEVVNLSNKQVSEIEIPDSIFGIKVFPDLIHQYIRYQNAKSRQGSHKTKTRSEVNGRAKKPFSQKGTGNARQGSSKPPNFRGGATSMGPQNRDHSFSLNKNDYNYRRLIKVYCHHFYNNSKNKKKFLKKYDLIKVHFINQLLTF